MGKSIFQSVNATPPGDADPYAQRVTAQAIGFLYRGLPGVVVSTTLMPIIMVWVMWGRIDHAVLIGWCAAAFAIIAARLLLSRAYSRQTPAVEQGPRWGRYFTFTALANGLVWGGAGILFFVPNSAALQVFLFTSIIGLCAGSIILLAYWLESYYAFVIPALSLSALRLVLEGGAGYRGLAVLLIMLVAILVQVGRNGRKSALAAIRLGFENLELVERLREEKAKAEAASRDKTRFLASASHDLRQPVHALTLFADALLPELTSAKAKALLGNMGRSIEALNQLLSSLLDISKLDANIVKPDPAHFTLRSLMDGLGIEYAPQAQAKGLAWRVHMAGDLVIYSDRVLLESMLRNLISNAIRYTNAGSIEVSCARRGMDVRIEVRDTGIGIPSDQRQEIFREFYQLANPERDRSKGLGLGLAIVDRLASLLNHRIELDSEIGKGSCFVIILPAGDLAAVAAPEALPSHLRSRDVSGMRVVVIDDEAVVREGMLAVLESWGCEIVLAGSEDEALVKINGRAPPHVIVADYRLRDGRTGAQAIERLRQELGAGIPALIVTGDTDPERLREAQASGHALMHKPVQPGKLRAYLRRVRRRAG